MLYNNTVIPSSLGAKHRRAEHAIVEHLWSQAGATGGNRWQMRQARNGSNKLIRNPRQPTATVQDRMVKRGSTVRVRQAGHCKSPARRAFVYVFSRCEGR
jgi:hypothetical protein